MGSDSFREFYHGINGKFKKIDIRLLILPPVFEVPSPILKVKGPLTQSMIQEYEKVYGQLNEEKLEKYNSVMATRWDVLRQIKSRRSETPKFSTEAAERVGVEEGELGELYNLMDCVLNRPEGENLYAKEEIQFEKQQIRSNAPTKVWMHYLAETGLLITQQHKYSEQIKFPYSRNNEEFSGILPEGEVGYILYELEDRIKTAGNKANFSVSGIQESQSVREYNSSSLKQKIEENYRKLKQ